MRCRGEFHKFVVHAVIVVVSPASGKSDAKIGSLGAGSARSGAARSSSTVGNHIGGSEKPGFSKRRSKKKECHSPLGNVRIVVGVSVGNFINQL